MSRIKIRLLLVWGVVALLVMREFLEMPGEIQRTEESARVQLATVAQATAQAFDTTLWKAAAAEQAEYDPRRDPPAQSAPEVGFDQRIAW